MRKEELSIINLASHNSLCFFLRIADLFPYNPGEEVEPIENDFCKPIVTEGVVFRPMVGNGDEEYEVDCGSEKDDDPGEGEEPVFGSPGNRV